VTTAPTPGPAMAPASSSAAVTTNVLVESKPSQP
jgi:hypothetical protein